MDNKLFNEIFDETCAGCKDLICAKGEEYERGDKFSAFRYSAALQRTTPERVLFGYMSKHIISMVDMVNDDKVQDMELVDAKVFDIINYAILYRAMCIERSNQKSVEEAEHICEDSMVKQRPFKFAPKQESKPVINSVDNDGDVLLPFERTITSSELALENYYAGLDEVL